MVGYKYAINKSIALLVRKLFTLHQYLNYVMEKRKHIDL